MLPSVSLARVRSLLSACDNAVRSRPLSFGVAISTCKASGADLFAQRVLEGRPAHEVDQTRVAIFAAFGMGYCGVTQHFVYAVAHPRMAAAIGLPWPWGELVQLMVDQGLQVPFIYYPAFYATNSMIDSVTSGKRLDLNDVLGTWRQHVVNDIGACAAFWVPANGVNFLFVPTHWRVPYIAVTGFGWLCYLSSTRGRALADARTEAQVDC